MKIELGVGTMALVLFAGCGPRGVDLGGGERPGEPADSGGGSFSAGGNTSYGGTSAGGASAGGSPSCRQERIRTDECQTEQAFMDFAEQACSTFLGGTLTDVSFESCLEREGTATAATVVCCVGIATGGTGAGGFAGAAPVGGSSYGGTAGEPAGGSSYGGTSAGYGGTGGEPIGGTGAGGSQAGGSGGVPGEECWTTSTAADSCADNDVLLGRGYELCALGEGQLTSIAFGDRCDAYTSVTAEMTCCRRGTGGTAGAAGAGGVAGAAGAAIGGSHAGGTSAN